MAARANADLELVDPQLSLGLGQRKMSKQPLPDIAEDEGLVCAARNGDRDAFGRLYYRYARLVHGVLLAKVPAGEVDDLVQDVFILALRRLSTLREPASFGAWIATIARNRAHDYYRSSVLLDPIEDDFSEEAGSGKPDDKPQADAVLAALKSLPETYRETLILRLVEGMTGPEIAARTGMTHGSVRVNLHRGMQQLRQKLGVSAGASEPERGRE
jgi:RNA polymerase sigma-70 factor, ECF subfamily